MLSGWARGAPPGRFAVPMSNHRLLRLAEALALISPHVEAPRVEASGVDAVALDAASGRVLADDVHSSMALPSFDHAAMDGYALRASGTVEPGSEHAVTGTQAAGDMPRAACTDDACEIMTGGMLPQGLNAVVAVERCERLQESDDGTPERIRLTGTLHKGDNVRLAGSDVTKGQRVLTAGTRLQPAQIMLLAALGVTTVRVTRRTRVAVICTGKELQAEPGQSLAGHQICNSNGPFLVAALQAAGARVLFCSTVDDGETSYAAAVQRARDEAADIIISTGAVSMGRHDFVPAVLDRMAAQLLFHKLAIRPGKPVLCARFSDGPLVLALPGTPMAVAVGFRFLVTPVLRRLSGRGDETFLRAILDTPHQPRPGFRHFLRARLSQDSQGCLHASIPTQQQPFRIQPFAHADGWVILPEDSGDVAAGSIVEIAGIVADTPLG